MDDSLQKDLNYLNMKEIRSFCSKVGIPFKICYHREGKLRVSGEIDRKDIILGRIRTYAATGSIDGPTIYAAKVVNFDPAPKILTPKDHVFYGQYKTTNKAILKMMKSLTDDQFKFGALSQITIRDFWRAGKAPTFTEFAKAWQKAVAAHTKPREEWAFLTDLASGMDMQSWKTFRIKKARAVLKELADLRW